MSFSIGGEIIAKAIAKGLEVKSIQNGSDYSIHTYIQHIETKHLYIHTYFHTFRRKFWGIG